MKKPLSHHFSHPHGLILSKSADLQDQKCCAGCEQKHPLSGQEEAEAYSCPERDCDQFFLHKMCFELPKSITHKNAHPNHKLTLISEPPPFNCNACGTLINGFSFHCEECNFQLHVKCASSPAHVHCKAHEHVLVVQYDTPKDDDTVVVCDVCDGYIKEGYWSYLCKDCDFSTHVDCAFVAEAPVKEEEEAKEENNDDEEEEGLTDAQRLHRAQIKAMNQMAILQFKTNMAQMNASFMANLYRTRY